MVVSGSGVPCWCCCALHQDWEGHARVVPCPGSQRWQAHMPPACPLQLMGDGALVHCLCLQFQAVTADNPVPRLHQRRRCPMCCCLRTGLVVDRPASAAARQAAGLRAAGLQTCLPSHRKYGLLLIEAMTSYIITVLLVLGLRRGHAGLSGSRVLHTSSLLPCKPGTQAGLCMASVKGLTDACDAPPQPAEVSVHK